MSFTEPILLLCSFCCLLSLLYYRDWKGSIGLFVMGLHMHSGAFVFDGAEILKIQGLQA